jgi:enamine deaminase RidA (YjgF/YER057c/UK114 family)
MSLNRTTYEMTAEAASFQHLGHSSRERAATACPPPNDEKVMSAKIKHLLIGGLTIMTAGVRTATTADQDERRLTIVNPQHLYDPTPNGYSTAVIIPSGARVAYISGQGGQDSTGALSPDFAVQVKQAYANLRTAIEALGARPDQVAKLTIFVVDHDMSKLEVLTRNVKEMFGEALPAQTLIPVPKLAIDPMLFEVEAVVILE